MLPALAGSIRSWRYGARSCLFAALIIWMYWRIAYVPGGQPIGALEKFAGSVGRRLRTLFARRKTLHSA